MNYFATAYSLNFITIKHSIFQTKSSTIPFLKPFFNKSDIYYKKCYNINMFLFRIGKQKLAYSLVMGLKKIKYSHMSELNHLNQLLVHIKRYYLIDTARGNHEFRFVSTISKRGKVYYDNNSHTIPMTLYFDKESGQFNQKQMTVTGKILNDLNEEVAFLGEAELNLAKYAKENGTEQLIIEVELEGAPKKTCKIQFDVTISRCYGQDQEFTETISQPRTQRTDDDFRKKTKERKRDAKSPTQESGSSKSMVKKLNIYNQQRLSKMNQERMNTQKTSFRNKLNQSQQSQMFGNHENLMTERQKSIQFNDPASEDNDTVKLDRQLNTPQHLYHPELNNPDLPSLRLFQTQKALRIRQKQVVKLERELKDQKTINGVLLEQQRKQAKYDDSKHLAKQVETLQTQLEVANMKINQLQDEKKTYLQQVQTAQTDVDKLSRQVRSYKSTLQKTKYRIAQFVMKTYQTQDISLISFVEDLIKDDS